MTNYEIYVFVLCFVVFFIFTLLFSTMIVTISKMKLKMIRHGIEDEEIKKEHARRARAGKVTGLLANVFSLIVCILFLAVFSFSAYMNLSESKSPNGIPSLKVVKSSSMATVHEKNEYIAENGLTNQIQTFDIVVTHHLPPEEELKLYDIVVYEKNGDYIIHRIVGIEEPNSSHPRERHFLLQGDAVETADIFPVLYSQMQGIYRGERIPFLGSFVLFMQAPAGWLCIILLLFSMIATPILEKKIERTSRKRLQEIGYLDADGNVIGAEKNSLEMERILSLTQRIKKLRRNDKTISQRSRRPKQRSEDPGRRYRRAMQKTEDLRRRYRRDTR